MLSADVEKLWELQTVLTQLAEHERQMAVKPDSFAAIDQEHQSATDAMTSLEQTLEQLTKEKRRVDGEMSEQQELMKKYQGQLMLVKNQQQYAAAWKEIDTTGKHVKELEDSSKKNRGGIEDIEMQLEERRSAYEDIKSRYDAAHEAWQHSLSDLRAAAEKLRERAARIEATIPERLRKEFQKILKQRQNVAVAHVINDSCSACRTRVRPALYQQLKRGELVFCEGCRRILYLETSAS
jgi:predicted  nucleic acid-binding Zn-ribbon protein